MPLWIKNGDIFVKGFGCESDSTASSVTKRGQCSWGINVCSSFGEISSKVVRFGKNVFRRSHGWNIEIRNPCSLPTSERQKERCRIKRTSCKTDTKRIQRNYTKILNTWLTLKHRLIYLYIYGKVGISEICNNNKTKTTGILTFCKTSIQGHTDIISSAWLADWPSRAILDLPSRWIWGQSGVLVISAAL